jgi:benzoate 4-monooxygenase
MYSSFCSGIFILAILAAFVQPFCVYFLDRKHLRKFPAPQFAGLSSFWRIYQNLKYRHYHAIHEAHQKLGTHVRIAPNHVSISDPKVRDREVRMGE